MNAIHRADAASRAPGARAEDARTAGPRNGPRRRRRSASHRAASSPSDPTRARSSTRPRGLHRQRASTPLPDFEEGETQPPRRSPAGSRTRPPKPKPNSGRAEEAHAAFRRNRRHRYTFTGTPGTATASRRSTSSQQSTARPGPACSKSGAFYAEEGEEPKIKATAEEHAEVRGQAQTDLQRIGNPKNQPEAPKPPRSPPRQAEGGACAATYQDPSPGSSTAGPSPEPSGRPGPSP